MFHQLLTPVANNLFLSFLVGSLPILVVLILLGIVRWPAWQAALARLIVGFIIAVAVLEMPINLAATSTLNGFVFPLLPVMWIVWSAIWLYNVTVRSGKFDLFLGWIACFLTGSDTSANALFGNLQVVAAHQLNPSPVLMAATNSSGAGMGKMVSLQNVTTGVSTTNLAGKEGFIVGRPMLHSLLLASLLGLLVMAQQYLFPWIIPH